MDNKIKSKTHIRLNVLVEVEKYKRFKMECIKRDKSLTDVVNNFIGSYIKEEE